MANSQENIYAKWLLRMVLIEGRTTLWCAKETGGDPDDVIRDFNRYCTDLRRHKRKHGHTR
mgnify:CR=1 FL=1